MSLASSLMRSDYTGAGTTATYGFTFKIFAAADLRVISRDITSGVDTVLALTTDYTVTGIGATAGGTITLVAGNLATGKHLTIKRYRSATQGTDIRNQGDYYPETIEDTFDQIVMLAQQLQDDADRAVRIASSSTPSDFNPKFLATIAGAISKVPVTNSSGNGWADPATWPATTDFAAAVTAAANAAASATAASSSASAASTSASSASTSATSAAASAASAASNVAPAQGGARGSPLLQVAGTAISVHATALEFHKYVAGNAGPITITAAPQVAPGSSIGQKMLLIGRDDTNTVTLTNSTGLSLNGDITLGADDTLYLYWDGTNWSEITRRR